jgi:hypothetical protein
MGLNTNGIPRSVQIFDLSQIVQVAQSPLHELWLLSWPNAPDLRPVRLRLMSVAGWVALGGEEAVERLFESQAD